MAPGKAKLSRGFYGLHFGKLQFETPGNSIISYTKRIIARNLEFNEQIPREEVQWNWDGQIYNAYMPGDEKRAFFLGQVRLRVK